MGRRAPEGIARVEKPWVEKRRFGPRNRYPSNPSLKKISKKNAFPTLQNSIQELEVLPQPLHASTVYKAKVTSSSRLTVTALTGAMPAAVPPGQASAGQDVQDPC